MRKHIRDYFVPHEGNEYKPHSLQEAAIVGMVLMVMLSYTLANLQSVIWVSSQWMISTVLPSVIVDLTNEERADAVLGTLRRNDVLDEAARMKAEDMAKNEYFAHHSPTGVTPWYWFGRAGYSFVHAGENLAIHFTDSGDVVEAWMDSPTHRANIMNGNYSEIGVGTAEGTYEGFKTVYVVQLFGTPSKATAEVAGETSDIQTSDATENELEPEPESETTFVLQDTETEVTLGAETEEVVVLSDSVVLSENVEFVPAEPVLVESTSSAEESASAETKVIDMKVDESGVAMYSDFISTSTGAIPASIDPLNEDVQNSSASYFMRLATQPHVVLQILYAVIGLFVTIALVLSIFIEIRKQQPVQIAYGVALLLLMYGLFEIHMIVGGGAVII